MVSTLRGGAVRFAAPLLAVGLLAAACSSSGGPGNTSSHGAGSGTFVIAATASIQKLDPDVATDQLDFQALGLIYQTLVELGPNLQVEPYLATSWHLSGGNKILSFDLRKNVTFDDGSPLTSADVKATLERILNPKTAASGAASLASIKSISTPSADVVDLNLSHPDSSLLQALTGGDFSIEPAKAISAGTLAKTPDGTGPYRFSSFTPNISLNLTRNPKYWGPAPSISSIEFKTIAAEQSIAAALQAGTIQMGLLAQPQVVQTLHGTNLNVSKVLDLNYRTLMLQDRKGPLSNVNARLAMQCAIDRAAVLHAAVFGDGVVIGPDPVGPFASNASAGTCATPSLAAARSYLAKAGMPHGFSFTAMTSDALDSTSAAQAVTVQADLSKVGIKMAIDNVGGNDYVQRWLKGDFQAAFALNGSSPSPFIMYDWYWGKGAPFKVPAGFQSAKLRSLLANADESESTATQKADYAAFSNYLVSNAIWIWLFSSYSYYATLPTVHGFVARPDDGLQSLATATVS